MFSPILEEVAAELGAKAKIVKVNVDEEPSLAQQFGVMSIPTLAVIKDGKVVSTSVGLRSKEDVVRMADGSFCHVRSPHIDIVKRNSPFSDTTSLQRRGCFFFAYRFYGF